MGLLEQSEHCRQCGRLTDEGWGEHGAEPYHKSCWLIHYYGIDSSMVAKIDGELAVHQKRGVDADTLEHLRFGALNREAKRIIELGLSRVAPLIEDIRMRAQEQK